MKIEDIKKGAKVRDRWYEERGIGIITDVKKTVFTVNFNNSTVEIYDYPHATFLELITKTN